jgi:hypothetical protein
VRRLWVRALLVVATALSVLAIFAVWANRQLMNPANWSSTSTALLQKQTVRKAVAGFLVDQLYAHVDVQGQIRTGLPGRLAPLAGPISGALRGAAEQAAQGLLAQPAVQDGWRRANRLADEELIRVVNGRSGVRIREDTVVLDLRTLLAELGKRLGVGASVAGRLPPSVAEVKVLRRSDIGLVRSVARGLRPLAVLVLSLAACCYALALALSGGERRRTLLSTGLSLVVAGLVVLVARKIAEPQVVAAITRDASIEPAAKDAYSVATSLLVQVASSAIVIGLAAIAAACFAGPARWAVAARRFLAPHLRLHSGLAYWLAAALLVLVFAWGPIPATRNPVEMLLFALVALLGAHLLRRQVAAEFPAEQPVSVRTAARRYLSSLAQRVGRLGGANRPQDRGQVTVAGELERLAALHDRGALSEQEYRAAKLHLLGEGPRAAEAPSGFVS